MKRSNEPRNFVLTYKGILKAPQSLAYSSLFFTAQALLQAEEVTYRHSHSAGLQDGS